MCQRQKESTGLAFKDVVEFAVFLLDRAVASRELLGDLGRDEFTLQRAVVFVTR